MALFEISFPNILACLLVYIDPLFMSVFHREALGLAIKIVNNLFNGPVKNYFCDFSLVLVSKRSAGFSIYIPDFHLSMSDLIPYYASSFLAECFYILYVLVVFKIFRW